MTVCIHVYFFSIFFVTQDKSFEALKRTLKEADRNIDSNNNCHESGMAFDVNLRPKLPTDGECSSSEVSPGK